jgi:CNT family concentrative nucleoside transporter
MTTMMKESQLSPKTIAIVSFALCGFANFSSIAIQVGGIGELAPSRRADLAKLGFKALICGTLASYLSATVAGLLFSE